MGKTFKRLGRRNRFLKQRRERLPTIRTVETTVDDIDRRTLSPVRQSLPLKTSFKRREKDEYVSDDDDDDNVLIDEIISDAHDEIDYEQHYDKLSDEPIANDDIHDYHVENSFDDNIRSLNIINHAMHHDEEPTCSNWATACEKQVEEAEEEYQNTVFIDEIKNTSENKDTKLGRMVSIRTLGKNCYRNYENPYSIHYNR